MEIRDDTGRTLDQKIDVHVGTRTVDVVFHARSGSGASARNSDYARALGLVLLRMRSAGAALVDAMVDSGPARLLATPDRRVIVPGAVYPIALGDVGDVEALRRALMRGQAPIAQRPGARGGNETRRFRMTFATGADVQATQEIVDWITSGRRSGETLLDAEQRALESEGAFDPRDETDSRTRALRSVALRRGQPKFREALLSAYRRRCAVTQCGAEPVLEAAHIRPFRGDRTNTVRNGILLRSDIHLLFDERLLTVDVESSDRWSVLVRPEISDSYGGLAGAEFHRPRALSAHPSPDALRIHRRECNL